MVWNRKIAYIDLSNGNVIQKPIPKEMRILYLGGRGIDMYLLYNHVKPKTDPLAPENILLMGAGLLGGIPCLGSGRCDIAAKSPLTGAVGDSNIGGFFALELRLAGFDHLVISGRAAKPVYIWINDGEIKVKNASHLWRKDTFETQATIRNDHSDENIKSLVIGVAGENLVRFANVRTGMENSAGRTGMGAVMGSKNLKAVAVRGTTSVEFSHPDELLDCCKEINEMKISKRLAKGQSKWDTIIINSNTNTIGAIRTKNFQLNKLEEGEDLGSENIGRYSNGATGCYGCVAPCRHRYVLMEGSLAPLFDEGWEHVSIDVFGTMVNCKKVETILVANQLMSEYGLDTLETGRRIAWALRLYSKGMLNEKQTDGLKLEWGDEDIMFELIRKIATREGFGNVLADGFGSAITDTGSASNCSAKNVESMSNHQLHSRPAIGMHSLRQELLQEVYKGPATLDYTLFKGKAQTIWRHERLYAVTDSIGTCKFQTVSCASRALRWDEFSKLIRLATGLEFSKTQLIATGERICTLERLFNLREGFTRKDDALPKRYFRDTPIGLPIARGKKTDRARFEKTLDQYYTLHNWDQNGVPTKKALERLKLDKEPTYII